MAAPPACVASIFLEGSCLLFRSLQAPFSVHANRSLAVGVSKWRPQRQKNTKWLPAEESMRLVCIPWNTVRVTVVSLGNWGHDIIKGPVLLAAVAVSLLIPALQLFKEAAGDA
ncbi:hypothetical protein GDO81_020020, partial [Engystomops pustulosus]